MRDLIQGSDEWYAARLGRVTASKVHDVIARLKSGAYGAGRANYLSELVLERLTGSPTETYCSPAMQWGKDCEPQARASYAFLHDAEVATVGFVQHPGIEWAGASPDGLVGDDGLIEVKCPNSATHLATLRGAPPEIRYASQMQWQMACTGRAWCDFASFDPRFPGHLQLHVRRIYRDDAIITAMEGEVRAFLEEVAAAVAELEARAA